MQSSNGEVEEIIEGMRALVMTSRRHGQRGGTKEDKKREKVVCEEDQADTQEIGEDRIKRRSIEESIIEKIETRLHWERDRSKDGGGQDSTPSVLHSIEKGGGSEGDQEEREGKRFMRGLGWITRRRIQNVGKAGRIVRHYEVLFCDGECLEIKAFHRPSKAQQQFAENKASGERVEGSLSSNLRSDSVSVLENEEIELVVEVERKGNWLVSYFLAFSR
jgi:hypothetical protein